MWSKNVLEVYSIHLPYFSLPQFKEIHANFIDNIAFCPFFLLILLVSKVLEPIEKLLHHFLFQLLFSLILIEHSQQGIVRRIHHPCFKIFFKWIRITPKIMMFYKYSTYPAFIKLLLTTK